ncbi:hypothetical protein [Shewanella fidelis]|uniref:Uncharacterized protein n=1 Tax=Shewanella fidelis TaxID=173509 RepID=A0AAW8NPG3_9GAMM|nr:hypothetical protein [Shewanella fidelis]MDR8524421.1 hypothetical protein [Shewanella fidelis]MDW4811897.1 hypothetical protein [Shewanella fidelis]MDW4817164.1 hypothetical protein [Shewanella fidelis]MDW4821234.1 hypothetical protein [Shewanella fidelis]MDW4822503.1 hypothetical protein [Shewanella fidelis]
MDLFIRSNYAGGFYLFGIASSVSIIATKIISSYNWQSLQRYLIFSFVAFIILILTLYDYAFSISALLCIFAALLLHLNGFMLAVLIRDEKIQACFFLQLVQPAVFLTGILLSTWLGYDWAYPYFLSTFIAFFAFIFCSNFNRIYNLLNSKGNAEFSRGLLSYSGLFLTLISSMSFPLFFQLELFFVGELTSLSLGKYTVLQKMYSSVSVALFGGVLVHLYGKDKSGILPLKKVLTLPLITSFVVSCVAIILSFLGDGLSSSTLLLTIFTSYVFSIAMFVTFAMSINNAKVNIYLMVISFLIYLVVFQLLIVDNITIMLGVSLVFYISYILMFVFFYFIKSKFFKEG